LEDATIKELFEFGESVTQEELRYFDDFRVDFLVKHGIYIKGIKIGDKLAGIGGIYKTHGINSAFYMVKREFQGRGIGNYITKNNIDYAKRYNIPLLFYICSNDNAPMIKSVKKYGDKEVFNYKDKRYSYLPITFKGKIIGLFLPLAVRVYVLIKNRREN
jgi:GNAT superfamily N-acetyltransferase